MQVEKQHLELDMKQQIRKGVCQGYILSSCLFNLYTKYIMWNAGLDVAQAGIKIAGRNFNNLRYADDTTLTAESEEELKSLLIKVKEVSEKVGLFIYLFFKFYFIFKLYKIVLVLPNIKMNPPQV